MAIAGVEDEAIAVSVADAALKEIQMHLEGLAEGNGRTRAEPKHARWAEYSLLLQIACQLLLLVPFIGSFRILMRTASFAVSLAMLVLLRPRGIAHPARIAALLVLGILAVSIFNPATNTVLAGAGEIALNVAILAPVFWVTRLPLNADRLRSLLLILLVFHSVSSVFGILQTYYPGQFQPPLSQNFSNVSADQLQSLMITTADGKMVYRPMGLTDSPGGAGMAGFYASLLGAGFFLQERRLLLRIACLASMVIGVMCILLSQVRSELIMLACCLLALVALLMRRGEARKLATLSLCLAGIVLLGFTGAVALGGQSVVARLDTLTAGKPAAVYQKNRGHFLQQTMTQFLPQYPLGAGLGRWGMMNSYFGDNSNPAHRPIWVEIQWTGWLLDGGVPLILAYVMAILLAVRAAWRIAMGPREAGLWMWGALVLAYDVGAIAVTFNYPLFISQGGMEFWLLNAALFTAACRQSSQASRRVSSLSGRALAGAR